MPRPPAWTMSLLFLVALTWPGAPHSAPAKSSSPPSEDHYRLKLVKVYDREGWGQPVEAYRFLIPADWKVEAWARWESGNIGCPDNLIDAGVRALAPDGVTAFEVFPAQDWTWDDDPTARQSSDRSRCTCSSWAPVPVAIHECRTGQQLSFFAGLSFRVSAKEYNRPAWNRCRKSRRPGGVYFERQPELQPGCRVERGLEADGTS